jgi:hypothetical protein
MTSWPTAPEAPETKTNARLANRFFGAESSGLTKDSLAHLQLSNCLETVDGGLPGHSSDTDVVLRKSEGQQGAPRSKWRDNQTHAPGEALLVLQDPKSLELISTEKNVLGEILGAVDVRSLLKRRVVGFENLLERFGELLLARGDRDLLTLDTPKF